MGNLKALKVSWQLNRDLLKMEQENFTNLEDDYRQGKVAYLDLVTGLSDLLAAKTNFYTNYINLMSSLAQYRYYEGTIYDFAARG